jgi:hypothetical protein
MRTIYRLLSTLGLFVALLVAAAAASTPDDTSRPAPVAASYTHAQLQPSANMTEQMSGPSVQTGSQVHRGDPQFELSQNPAYVAALEQHERDVDRMLARSDG